MLQALESQICVVIVLQKEFNSNRTITSIEEEIALCTIISRQLQIWETEGKSMKMFFPIKDGHSSCF
jgi:hypothetical protein